MNAIHRSAFLLSGILVTTLGALTVTGCWKSDGNGHLVLEHRVASDFTQVDNQTSLAVSIVQGSSYSVDVRVDSNLVPFVETRVEGGVLRIDESEPFAASDTASVSVVLPLLDAANNTGSGDMTICSAQQPGDVRLTCTGSGSMFFSGNAGSVSGQVCGAGSLSLAGSGGHLSLRVTGSGSVDSSGFAATGADLETTGSGSVIANVTGDATLSSEGSGSIDAALNGGTASFSVTGSGSITWSGDESVSSVVRTGSGTIEHR